MKAYWWREVEQTSTETSEIGFLGSPWIYGIAGGSFDIITVTTVKLIYIYIEAKMEARGNSVSLHTFS